MSDSDRSSRQEQWATMRGSDDVGNGKPMICLWGDQRSAIENCDPDERVCRVRVEVIEILNPLSTDVEGDFSDDEAHYNYED